MSLRDFYTDAKAADSFLEQAGADSVERVRVLVDALCAIGISSDRITVDDFAVFAHERLTCALDGFVDDAPGLDIPLASITIVQYALLGTHESDLASTLADLRANAESMTKFARHYNIEINLHVYIQQLSAEGALSLAEFAESDALDQLGFFYDFRGADCASTDSLKGELQQLCRHSAMQNSKISLGNFPFCLLPRDALKLTYRDAVSELKGHIGEQRALVKEVKARSFDYHSPCATCCSREACYVYTDIAEHSELEDALEPRNARTLVFAGASISRDAVDPDADQVWCGPAQQGDMLAAVLDGFETILIIDGYFYTRFPCTTFEVMLALEQGVNVFGASSIGALRAVELDRYGMCGLGYVYEHLKGSDIRPYHVVAQTYDENDGALTVPLIQILYFLECAEAERIVGREDRLVLEDQAESIHFLSLSLESFFSHVEATEFNREVLARLRAYWTATGGGDRFDIKKHDARVLLDSYRGMLAARPAEFVRQKMVSTGTALLSALRAKYPQAEDFRLKHRDEAGTSELSAVSRDNRVCSAAETCTNAEAFMADLSVQVADTTRYDPAGSHILSAFFIPFYFLNYYPSSATGNGDVFDEALASAAMELVERLSACCHDIQGVAEDALDRPPIALDGIPQFYNWGASEAVKAQAISDHGYVSVSDLLSGEAAHIPASSIMFRYSGTDGFSAGNTISEAILYGLYEVIERDTCRIHHHDPSCREFLPRLRISPEQVTDARCLGLLAEFEDKGCDIACFLLPNLSGLPCVMCHVYDRNRRVQCHGSIAVRSDFSAALHAALHEAVMQYVTYFVGTRDDYRAFASAKQARMAFDSAQRVYFDEEASAVALPGENIFASIGDELDAVSNRLTSTGVTHILVADLGPEAAYRVEAVKVIVPGLDLWFCPDYIPSPFLAERAKRTAELVRGITV